MIRTLVSLLILGSHITGYAQDVSEISLADLMGIKTTIASKRSLTARESPAILTIVTREEIVLSGARDLKEVLEFLVPGTYIGSEIEGVSGLGMRGIWGFDSRMLLMIDGIDMNEDVFGSFVLGNHYPAEMLERVEVIRGPGSVIYGGYAAVGVVNVITRSAGRKGTSVAARYSQTSKTYSHRNITAATSGDVGEFSYDIFASGGEGQRGDGDQFDNAGNKLDVTNEMDLDPQIYKAGLKYKGFELKGIVDLFRTTYVTPGWAPIGDERYLETFRTYAAQMQYKMDVSKKFRITPKYDLKETIPWRVRDLDPVPSNNWEFAKKSVLHRLGVHAEYDITKRWGLISGVEYSSLVVSHLKDNLYDPDVASIKNETSSLYLEGTYRSRIGRFILGGRYENPKNVDGAFVPRFGWTRARKKYHGKFMVSQSFRSPVGIIPARTAPGETLKPELVTNVETEVGYQLNSKNWLVGNLYYIKIEDALVYGAGQTGLYGNEGTIGTRGFEAEHRFKDKYFNVNTSLAYYRAVATSVATLQVPGKSEMHRGAPAMRATAHVGYKINDKIEMSPTISYFGERYGQTTGGAIKKHNPAVVFDLNFRYQNLLNNLHLTAGVVNLADTKLPLVQGYQNGVVDVPNYQRALNLMLAYEY